MRTLFGAFPLVAVTALSLFVIAYVGYGDAQRNYQKFHQDKLSAQGALVHDLMEDFLKEGLPLSFISYFLEEGMAIGKFAGFSTFSEGQGNGTGSTLTLTDHEGRVIFSSIDKSQIRDAIEKAVAVMAQHRDNVEADKDYRLLLKEKLRYQVVFFLRNSDRMVGSLIVTMPESAIHEGIEVAFAKVRLSGIILTLLFFVFIMYVRTYRQGTSRLRKRLSAAAVYAVLAVGIIGTALYIYAKQGNLEDNYRQYYMDKLMAQNAMLHELIGEFTGEGLPLAFVGGLVEELDMRKRIAGSFSSAGGKEQNILASLSLADTDGQVLFSDAGNADVQTVLKEAMQVLRKAYGSSAGDAARPRHLVRGDRDNYYVISPVHDNAHLIGALLAGMPKSLVRDSIGRELFAVLLSSGGLALLFILLLAMLTFTGERAAFSIKLAYAATFTAMSAMVLTALINLYTEGAQIKSLALAKSLAHRLSAIVESGTQFTEVQGLGKLLENYQNREPDINVVALIHQDKVYIHPEHTLLGSTWKPDPNSYEYLIPLDLKSPVVQTKVLVSMPREVVRNKIIRNIKNFSALFIAAAFVSFLFLNVATSLKSMGAKRRRREENTTLSLRGIEQRENMQLSILKTVWFMAIFNEALGASFLPQYFGEIVSHAGLPLVNQSLLFSVFAVMFALVLLPAGRYVDKHDPKKLIIFGLGLEAIALLLMAGTQNFYLLLAIRGLAGAAQGTIFICIQLLLMNAVAPERKIKAAGVIVFGFNGGLISGAAIGALLVSNINENGIFAAGAAMAMLTLSYAATMIVKAPPATPEIKAPVPPAQKEAPRLGKFRQVIKDPAFMKSLLLAGAPSKAIYSGVGLFAIPLVMEKLNYGQDDIGQAMMLFAGAILLGNYYIAATSKRIKSSEKVITWSMLAIGAGLCLISLMLLPAVHEIPFAYADSVILFGGLVFTGVAVGCLFAPLVVYVQNSCLASSIGRGSTVALYRFLERLGYAAGPILIGYLLVITEYSAIAFLILGTIMMLSGGLFALRKGVTV